MVRFRRMVLHNRDEFKLFLKFAMVGTSGALVDLGLLTLLYQFFNVPLLIAVAIAFLAAVINNYIWNILWTYSHQDHSAQHHITLSKFSLVSIVGLGINEAIVTFMTVAFSERVWLVAKLAAMGIVMFWNFTVNRMWTFRE